MTYLTDIVVDVAMAKLNISYSAALTLKYINRYVNASRLHCVADMKGIPYCYASKEKLAQRIGKSKRTVARAIAELKAAGVIESRRTKGIAHIYLTCYVLDGICVNGKNGTCINTLNKSYNNRDTSFYPDKTPAAETKTSDDVKKCRGTAENQTPAATPAAKETNASGSSSEEKSMKKGKPTPKQRKRTTKAEKQAAAEKYSRLLERKLGMANPYWLLPDDAVQEEYKQRYSLIDLIANAMSIRGRQIRVNGAELTVEQYWQVVQNISEEAIEGLFDRLKTAAVCTGISNMRAYTLASVYNAVLWHGMTASANIDLYRHTAG